MNALMAAAINGNVNILDMLFVHEPDKQAVDEVIHTDGYKRNLLLFYSCFLLWLFQSGVTPLMYAAYYGHGGAVEALLSYGRSDANAVDNVSFYHC